MEVLEELVLIGIDEDEAARDLTAAEPGRVTPIRQALYRQAGDWEPGEPAGEVHVVAVNAKKGKAHCQFHFTLNEEDSLEASGVLPAGDAWFGGGVVAVIGGTGRYAKASGSMLVETNNPKRYSIVV